MKIKDNSINSDKIIIYLADLVHNFNSKGPHVIPVNIGYISAYAKKIFQNKVAIQIFKYPGDLINAIKNCQPDIIGLSSYVWNRDINKKIASWVKSKSEKTVIAFGGPDYLLDDNESLEYFQNRPDLDFYIHNQGESGFANLIQRYIDCNSISEMKETALNNCVFLDTDKNILINGEYHPIQDLSQIPSPFLTGTLDKFFDDNLIPLVETNRGCPYKCTYCAWGKSNKYQKKIMQFPLARVKEEIQYIANKTKDNELLMIGDANFGLFERDVEIAEFVKNMHDTFNFPRDLVVSWSKTGTQRLIKMAEILKDIMGIAAAFGSFQSTDPQVMKNIKRTNLPWKDFKKIQDYFNAQGISTSSDLILGLPGETKQSHLQGLRALFDHNTSSVFCYNLRMIGGSEFNTGENRKKYDVLTKFRLIDGGYGKYEDIVSVESEEIVLQTNTLTYDESLFFRPVHFLIQFLWNYKYYVELLSFIKDIGINPMDLITNIIDKIDLAEKPVQEVFKEFKFETYDEWFDTQEELEAHYNKIDNFEILAKGGFAKMNFKYTYKILLECKTTFDNYMHILTKDLLHHHNKTTPELEEILMDLIQYTRYKYIDFSEILNKEKDEYEKILHFKYDVHSWKNDRYTKPLATYNKPVKLKFTIPDERYTALKKRFKRYQENTLNQTLRKMVEYMNEKDLFYDVTSLT